MDRGTNMSYRKLILTLFVLTFWLVGPACLSAEESGDRPDVNRDIEQLLLTKNLQINGVSFLTQGTLLATYQENDFAPYWTKTAQVRELMELIKNSAEHGLNPSDYNYEQLVDILQKRESSSSAEIDAEADILLSESFFRYGYHRRLGKVEASKLDKDINFTRESFHHQ
jgi:murein L,D-transpeptidase YcbB/YkuD